MIDMESFREKEFLRREEHLQDVEPQHFIPGDEIKKKIHIVYVMTHVEICGGTKIILEHANHLCRAGQTVTLVSHFEQPLWFPFSKKINYIQVPFEKELAKGIPDCDVIIATYWREISECIDRGIAPVVYFEQGDYHLFDWEGVPEREKKYIYRQFQLVSYILTVSEGAASQIQRVFHRDAVVIHNAVNKKIFSPSWIFKHARKRKMTVLMVGSDKNQFKRMKDIKEAILEVMNKGYLICLIWITPDEPNSGFGTVYVNPKQKKIGKLFRKADLLISASLYESFSLPCLEAMASGCAVLTTENLGVSDYAFDFENCLFIKKNNPEDIANQMIRLFKSPNLYQKIVSGGIKTAEQYDWKVIIPQLVEYYRKIASGRLVEHTSRNQT